MPILQHKRRGRLPRIEVVDLFCGIGGLSYGMKQKGLEILAGFDVDDTCKFAYETNNNARFFFENVVNVTPDKIKSLYSKKSVRVLAGCAPCQPFSSYAFKNKNKDSEKYDLLYEFLRLVKGVKPDIVTMEGAKQICSGSTFEKSKAFMLAKYDDAINDIYKSLDSEKNYSIKNTLFWDAAFLLENKENLVFEGKLSLTLSDIV